MRIIVRVDRWEQFPHPWAAYLPEGWEFESGTPSTGDLPLAALPQGAVVERKTRDLTRKKHPQVTGFGKSTHKSRRKSTHRSRHGVGKKHLHIINQGLCPGWCGWVCVWCCVVMFHAV